MADINAQENGENAPLLSTTSQPVPAPRGAWVRIVVPVGLTVVFAIAAILAFALPRAQLPILDRVGVVDTHIDLPLLLRMFYKNDINQFDMRATMPGHVDIARLRTGHVGGVFWSVFVPCSAELGKDEGPDFMIPTYRVRDTLEQIDITKLMIDEYPDVFEYATTAKGMRAAMSSGKVASLIGVEGGHQLENSLGVLRMYYELGARYMTLTHTCNNAFADSAGIGATPTPLHGGLSPFGVELIYEMNRLGMMVDISHVSDDTAIQAFNVSRAPLLFSHSSSRAVHNVRRNVPDSILELIGEGEGKKDAVVMVIFAPDFVADKDKADVKAVADHVVHIAHIAGPRHVGIGSDYDGITSVPQGLEDVSKYPALFEELRSRGWDDTMLAGLAQYNLLRVFEGVEKTAMEMRWEGVKPAMALYDKRADLLDEIDSFFE
ncbi:hypothetical protein DACRYDRAFT_114453 [Dacryopinax primogenitus]|uniref:Dipeptidase n=1 Tax=Dacryopinax primogenitus (strain DJM 731) TaxID=1858805 RepID=M5G5P0_DACPD|nr:uncharacterized protein DACRYDRAFT_114453 [Dacryopinax primogenitus]EJU04024.1 hypothetical protein DACRYDRAFT_114453 [Dacryopinax primogenitus]